MKYHDVSCRFKNGLVAFATTALLCLYGATEMYAEDFFLRGNINIERGAQLGIEEFFVQRIDNPAPVSIKFENTYRKRLPLSDYANSTILYSFDFPENSRMYSLDGFSVFIQPGLQAESTITKDFAFFTPATFIRVLTEYIEGISQSDDCDQFALAASRLSDIVNDGIDTDYWNKNSFYRTSKAAGIVTFKLINHSCNPSKLDPALSALEQITSYKELLTLSKGEKLSLGEEVSFAISRSSMSQPDFRTINSTGARIIGNIVDSIQDDEVDSKRVASLIFARIVFLQRSDDKKAALELIRESIPLLEDLRQIRGQILLEMFLMISGSQLSADGRSISVNSSVPSDDFFAELPETEILDWCYLVGQLNADPVVEAIWKRGRSHSSLRREMISMRERIEKGEVTCSLQ